MKTIRFFAVLVSLFSASEVLAEGRLKYSINGQMGFTMLEVHEMDGMIEGTLSAGWGSGHFRTYVVGDTLYMELNQLQHFLKFTPSNNGKTLYYVGKVWDFAPSHINVYPALKDGFDIRGSIVNNPFVVRVNTKKQTLQMDWDGLLMDLKAVSDSPGKCKGVIKTESAEKVATVVCQSSGSLTHAFFTSHDQVLAFLVHFLVMPRDELR